MNLGDYLKRHQITHAAFAADIGVSPALISRFLSGGRGPSLDTALRIEQTTKGAVPLEAWPSFAALKSRGVYGG